MDRSPDLTESLSIKERVSPFEKLKTAISGVFINKEMHLEKDAFYHPWDDAMCLALKTEIEAKPEWADVDKITTDTYERLIELLGPHYRSGITLNNIKNRIIFTDADTISAFQYLYEQPGENNDKYWKNPISRILDTRDIGNALKIILPHAITYRNLGIVMIPNEKEFLTDIGDIHKQYIEKQGISQFDYSELILKSTIAHELTHYLYSEGLKAHHPLNEPITDFIVTLVFPEIQGVDVRFAWAKASIEDYLTQLGYQSVNELTQPTLKNIGQSNEKTLYDVAMSVRQKYFSKLMYEIMGLPEEILNEKGLSKFSPIPQ